MSTPAAGDPSTVAPTAAADTLPPAQQQSLDAFALNLGQRRDLAQVDLEAALTEHLTLSADRSARLLPASGP
jgi:hypothetical protein